MPRIARIPLISILMFAAGRLHAETDWSLWVANETSYLHLRTDSVFNPDQLFFQLPKIGNDFLINGRLSRKLANNRIRLQVAAVQKLSHAERANSRFLLREAFAVFTLNSNLDFSIGKKLVKWGTGAGYNPSGFADPPKDPQDPNDRLSLNQGTELIQMNWVRGNHSIDVVYFAPRLYFTRDPIRSRDRLALRYDRLWKGLDVSIMGLVASNSPNKLGANYSYVQGKNLELHGELALLFPGNLQAKRKLLADLSISAAGAVEEQNMPVQSVFGCGYTFLSGWTLTAEWHHDGEGFSSVENRLLYDRMAVDSTLARDALTLGDPAGLAAVSRLVAANGMLAGIRQNKDTLFLMAGIVWDHEKFSTQSVVLRHLQDGSTALIPSINAQLNRNWQLYLRPSFFLGRRKSEYGSLMTKMVLMLGLRYNL